ncbi:MAG TPA: RelA/SpoT domain-containing protein, partial [Candidatus Paceibacterota bacterium]
MKLSQMQDIGGVRAVVPSEKDVRKLVAEYKSSKFKHRLIREKDYISNPRREDGYRSYHLIYEYNNPKAPEYKGLALELQLRTKLQHSWATAVETVGFILNQALKSRHGDKEWLEFFATVSAAFAREEGTEPVPEFEKMSVEKT